MSLTGNLEDLPLLDILQIVSFSKKTGYLTIQAPEGQGAIVFHDGLVVSAFTWESLPVDARVATLPPERRHASIKERIVMALERLTRLREGQFNFALVENVPKTVGLRDITLETLPMGINPQEMLLDLARGLDEDRRDSTAALEASFADVPAEAFGGDPVADDLGEETGDSVVASFVQEATAEPEEYSSPLEELAEEVASSTVALPPVEFEPEPAPAPEPEPEPEEELEAEAAAQEEPEPEAPPALAPPPPPPPRPAVAPAPAAVAPAAPPAEKKPKAKPAPTAGGPPPRTILLIDDEDDVRGIIGGLFRVVGYEVIEAEDPDSGVKAAHTLGKAGTPFLLLVDLGMPASGGASFQGGFEVVKRLAKMHLKPPVLMMAESLNPGLQSRAKQMGITSFVFKPGLSKLDRKQFEADIRAFATRLVQDILPSMGRPEGHKKAKPRLKGSAEEPPHTIPATAADLTRELGLLQERLAELRKQSDPTQIAMMVMRVAKEFFERGVLLLVKNEELRGLGGFGMAPKEHKIGLVVRDIVIPLKEDSIFRDVAEGQKTFVGPMPDGKWTKTMLGKIGRFKAGGIVLVPLLTNRETIALLYGDNPETGVTPGRLDTLELFINQAGIALENAFLQRKVRGM
jgi:CheY-like chemotaxis protein